MSSDFFSFKKWDVFFKKITTFFYFLLVFFIAFDGLRNAVSFSKMFSYIRETAVLLVFLACLVYLLTRNRKLSFNKFFLFMPFLFCVFFIGLPSSINPYYPDLDSITHPVVMSYRSFQFFMLLVAFYLVEEMTGKSYVYFFNWLVFFLVIYALITPYLYFFKPFFMNENWHWWGRIGVGYPTMDGQVYNFSMIFLFYILEVKKIKFNLVFVFLFVGILLQVTGTGFFTLFFLVFYYLFFYPRYLGIKKIFPSFVFLLVIVSFIVLFALNSDLGKINQVVLLAETKVMNLFGYGENRSIDIRNEQLKTLLYYVDQSYLTRFFGLGNKIYVENQYSYMLAGFGYFGLFIYVLFLLWCLVYGFLKRRKDNHVLFLSTIVFSLTSYTLITSYLYPLYSIFALCISYSIRKIQSKEQVFND